MRKKPFFLKAFVVVFLLLSGFMFSGAEAGFCQDEAQQVSAHQCFTCQSAHFAVFNIQPVSTNLIFPKEMFQIEVFKFSPQTPSTNFFRPPIFA